MRIATCVKNPVTRTTLTKWLEQYCALYHIATEIASFETPEEYLDARRLRVFDMLFVGLPGPEGFLSARMLREQDAGCKMVFISDTTDYVYIADEETHTIRYADEHIKAAFGGDVVGKACQEAMYGRSVPGEDFPELQPDAPEPYRWELILRGTPPKMYIVTNRLFQKDGKWYRIGQMSDISEYLQLSGEIIGYTRDLQEKTEYRAEHDQLTGLENRSCFTRRVEGEYAAAGNFGVIFLDVNDMKSVNDALGHEAGDELLRTAASSIRAVLGSGVHGYRMGGDEFMLVCTDCREADVEELMERWDAALRKLNERSGARNCRMAAGFAWGQASETLKEIMKRADAAMYRAKAAEKTGRDFAT